MSNAITWDPYTLRTRSCKVLRIGPCAIAWRDTTLPAGAETKEPKTGQCEAAAREQQEVLFPYFCTWFPFLIKG